MNYSRQDRAGAYCIAAVLIKKLWSTVKKSPVVRPALTSSRYTECRDILEDDSAYVLTEYLIALPE